MNNIDNDTNDFSFSKYFISELCFSKKEFIKKFNGLINTNVNKKNDGVVSDRLYANSSSQIYYPKKNIINNTKNILLITHELSRTGAPIVVLDTAKVLVKNGYFVTLITPQNGPLLKEFLDIGVPVIIMNEMKYIQYLVSETNNFVEKLDLDNFVNNFDLTIMVTATLYNFVRRYFNTNNKILWWIHEGAESYNILDSRMPKTITPNIKVLCGGQYAADQLKLRNYLYYPRVLNYGVFDEYKVISKPRNKKVRFLLAGTIGKRKGQLILLQAIQKLPKEIQENSEFIFIGDPYENDLEGISIKEQLQEYATQHENVKLYQSVSRYELYKLYEEIDVLVLASIDDPMPVVATENFMLGNICLCSTQTGTSYYIENGVNGFVFQSGNSTDLSDKLSDIIKNKKELDKIKLNGRKIYDKYFEIGIFERKLLQIIQGEVR